MSNIFLEIEELVKSINLVHPSHKGFCRLGNASEEVVRALSLMLGEPIAACELLLDGDAVRHILKEHGEAKKAKELARGQEPIGAADIAALGSLLPVATQSQPGQAKPGKQPRLEIQLADTLTTVIVEWRPGRQQLAVVTMYKKRPAT